MGAVPGGSCEPSGQPWKKKKKKLFCSQFCTGSWFWLLLISLAGSQNFSSMTSYLWHSLELHKPAPDKKWKMWNICESVTTGRGCTEHFLISSLPLPDEKWIFLSCDQDSRGWASPGWGNSGFCSVSSVAVGDENPLDVPEWFLQLGWDLLIYQGFVAMRGEFAAFHKFREKS